MSVFVVAQLRFTNIEKYRIYQSLFANVFGKHAEKLLVADEKSKVLDGDWDIDKLIIMSFPDDKRARLFLDDPEYFEISKHRKAGSYSRALLVQGLD